MSWIEKILPRTQSSEKSNVPEGIWTKCSNCDAVLYRSEIERLQEVCPKCDHHMRISARSRLHHFLDVEGRQEIGVDLEPQDLLKFKDSKKYKDRLSAAQKATNEKDALVVIQGTLKGMPVVAASFEFSFLGGSMASGVGSRFVAAAFRHSTHSMAAQGWGPRSDSRGSSYTPRGQFRCPMTPRPRNQI